MTRGGAGREAGPQPMSLAPPHLPRNNQDVPARRWGAAWDLTCYFVRPAAARALISPSREGLWLILVLGLGWGRKPSCEFASEPGPRYLLLTRLCHFQVLWREVLNFQWEEKARGCCALVSLFGGGRQPLHWESWGPRARPLRFTFPREPGLPSPPGQRVLPRKKQKVSQILGVSESPT